MEFSLVWHLPFEPHEHNRAIGLMDEVNLDQLVVSLLPLNPLLLADSTIDAGYHEDMVQLVVVTDEVTTHPHRLLRL